GAERSGARCGGLSGAMGRSPGRAIDPAAVAAGVVLLLPDRHARLDLVDHPAAGVERRAAVRGADADPDGAVADRERADPMLRMDREHVEALTRLGEDLLAFGDGDRLMGLVLEGGHGLAFVVVPHPALERHAGARSVVPQARL